MTDQPTDDFGRADEQGNVYVRTSAGERLVGQWPQGDPEAALAFYRKRYDGLVLEVDLLAQRLDGGTVSPDDAQKVIGQLRSTISEAHAVGDLDGLLARLDGLAPKVDAAREQRRAEKAARTEESRAAKTAIVDEAERLAGSNDWRGGANRFRQLLEDWKKVPRIDRASDDELWHRFSSARTSYTRRRKAHFAERNEKQAGARVIKEGLVTEAEALQYSQDWGPTSREYRELMRRWKAAGPAPKEIDDALWAKFRAAQDTFFGARDAANAELDREYAANAEVKRALIAEAEALLPVDDDKAAKDQFRVLAQKWDAAGKVPRSDIKELEGRFKKVEQAIRGAEDARWRRTNPEGQARAADTVRQLEESIASLEAKAARHDAAGRDRQAREAREAAAARQLWLDQARQALTEFGG